MLEIDELDGPADSELNDSEREITYDFENDYEVGFGDQEDERYSGVGIPSWSLFA